MDLQKEDAFASSEYDFGYAQIAFGSNHCIALDATGEIYTWGNNYKGALGLGDDEQPNESVVNHRNYSPSKVSDYVSLGGLKFKQIGAGGGKTYALSLDGDIWACGANNSGELGTGDTVNRTVLTKVELPGVKFAKISPGENHMLALSTQGDVWVWGNNSFGNRLGVNTGTDVNPNPIKLDMGDIKFKAVSGSEYDSYILSTAGKVYKSNSTTFARVEGLPDDIEFKDIVAGGLSAFALTTDGHIWSWGRNAGGILGLGVGVQSDEHNMVATPQSMCGYIGEMENVNFESLWCGIASGLGIDEAGELYCWGNYQERIVIEMLGLPADTPNLYNDYILPRLSTPTKLSEYIPSMAGIHYKSLSRTEAYHGGALDTNGNIYSWGAYALGRHGVGTNTRPEIAAPVFTGNIVSVPKIEQVYYKTSGLEPEVADDKIPTELESISIHFDMPMAKVSNAGLASLTKGGETANYLASNGAISQTWNSEGTVLTIALNGSILEEGENYVLSLDNFEKDDRFRMGTSLSLNLEADKSLNAGKYIHYTGLNGATLSPKPIHYNDDTTRPITIGTPTRAGYTFTGWNVDYADATPDLTGVTSFAIGTGVNTNITLSAMWSAINYTVSYTALNGTTLTNKPVAYNMDTASTGRTVSNPSRVGYSFDGWKVAYASTPAGLTSFTGLMDYSIPTNSATNITLTAVWTVNGYNINYVGLDNATMSAKPTTYNALTTRPISVSDPTKSNYTCVGWNVDYADATPDLTGVTSFAIGDNVHTNITLAAIFTENYKFLMRGSNITLTKAEAVANLTAMQTETTPGSVLANAMNIKGIKHYLGTDTKVTAEAILVSSNPAFEAKEGIYALKFKNALNASTTGIYYVTVIGDGRNNTGTDGTEDQGKNGQAARSWWLSAKDASITSGQAKNILNSATSQTAIINLLNAKCKSLASGSATMQNEAVKVLEITPRLSTATGMYTVIFSSKDKATPITLAAVLSVRTKDNEALTPDANDENKLYAVSADNKTIKQNVAQDLLNDPASYSAIISLMNAQAKVYDVENLQNPPVAKDIAISSITPVFSEDALALYLVKFAVENCEYANITAGLAVEKADHTTKIDTQKDPDGKIVTAWAISVKDKELTDKEIGEILASPASKSAIIDLLDAKAMMINGDATVEVAVVLDSISPVLTTKAGTYTIHLSAENNEDSNIGTALTVVKTPDKTPSGSGGKDTGNSNGTGKGSTSGNGKGTGNASSTGKASATGNGDNSSNNSTNSDNSKGSGTGKDKAAGKDTSSGESDITNKDEAMAASNNASFFGGLQNYFALHPAMWFIPAGLFILLAALLGWWFILAAKRRKDEDEESDTN
jgi:uncharacterized repeat protein (TIGR02543 family)